MNDQLTLQARFASPFNVVQTAWWLTDAEQRGSQAIRLRQVDPRYTIATGPAEAIMLLIGRMAASNNPSLIDVHVESNDPP